MLDLIRKLRHLLTPREQRHALVLLGLMTGGAALEMLGVGAIPAFVALLTDPTSIQRVPLAAQAAAALGFDTTEALILAGAVVLFTLFLLKNAYLAGLSWLQARYVFGRQVHLARRLLHRYLYSPYPFHLQRNTAELLRNANTDAMEVVGSALMPLILLVMDGLTVGAVLLLLFWVEPVTSVVAFLILGGASAIFLRLLRRKTFHHGQEMHKARLEMIQIVNEGLGGIKVTKVLGRERTFLDAFSRASDRYAHAGRVRQLLQETPRLLLETVGIAGLLGVAALLLVQGRALSALVPTLALLAVAVVRMIPSFNRVTVALNGLRFGRAAIDAVYRDLLEIAPGSDETPAPLPFRAHIRLEGVTFQYPTAVEPVLRDVSLTIRKGAAVGFVGRTGAGKTTLVDVVLGLLAPTAGRVLIDGVELCGRERAWQRQVGYVPQDVYLSDDSIRRNVAFGLPDEAIDEAAVWRTVEAAQAQEFIERLPHGLDTVVGERGVRLSGGQRQRIGIARALYHGPEVLVLDEATSALDHETERAVMEAIEHLRGSHTLLIIAHRRTTVAACDLLVHLQGGAIVEVEAHAESPAA